MKVVCHESLLEGFAEIAQSALVRKLKFLKYSLSTLQKTVYKSGSLKQSLLLYPNVTKVYFWLWMEGILKTLISSVCVFYNLILTENQSNWREELGIFWRGLTFEVSVFPLLKRFWNSITKLSLEGVFLLIGDISGIIEWWVIPLKAN